MWDVSAAPETDKESAGKSSDDAVREAFALRLNALCNDREIPPKGKNRQTIVGQTFGVGQKGARKWLEGESLPTLTKCIRIAEYFGVYVEWLLTGRGPKLIPTDPDPQLDGEIIELAKRIKSMPDENRKLLVGIFSTAAVQDDDSRLKRWDASAKNEASRLVGKRKWPASRGGS